MFFKHKVEAILAHLHQEKKLHDEASLEMNCNFDNQIHEPHIKLEKNDFIAMIIAASIVILPVAVIVLVIIGVISYFALIH